jgi:nitrate/TMAO reductase-like tetraheme cytochrome c subunit
MPSDFHELQDAATDAQHTLSDLARENEFPAITAAAERVARRLASALCRTADYAVCRECHHAVEQEQILTAENMAPGASRVGALCVDCLRAMLRAGSVQIVPVPRGPV